MKGDFKIKEGPNAGKVLDMKYTTSELTAKEVQELNNNFEINFAENGAQDIEDHLEAADIVAIDFRTLNPANQKIVTEHLKTLPAEKKAQIIILR